MITFIILSEPNSKFYMIGVVCNFIYFFTKIRLCEEYGKDNSLIWLSCQKVVDPWHAMQWQELHSYRLCPQSALGRLVCVDIRASCWAMSNLHNWIVFVTLITKITSTIPIIWVVKVTELDWILLIWLLTGKLIFKETTWLLW